MGLEALSNGFKHVRFVENNQGALKVLRSNVKSVENSWNKAEPNEPIDLEVINCDAFKLISKLNNARIVWSDPPYHAVEAKLPLLADNIGRYLLSDGLWCLECAKADHQTVIDYIEAHHPQYELIKQKSYGDSAIIMWTIDHSQGTI